MDDIRQVQGSQQDAFYPRGTTRTCPVCLYKVILGNSVWPFTGPYAGTLLHEDCANRIEAATASIRAVETALRPKSQT